MKKDNRECTPEEVGQLKYLLWKFMRDEGEEEQATIYPLHDLIREYEASHGGVWCRECKRSFTREEIDPCDIPF